MTVTVDAETKHDSGQVKMELVTAALEIEIVVPGATEVGVTEEVMQEQADNMFAIGVPVAHEGPVVVDPLRSAVQ
jgi:hypothetical protein